MIENLKNTFAHIMQDYSETIDKAEFNKRYGYRNIPVVFKKAFQNWHIKELFSHNNIMDNFPGDYKFSIESCSADAQKLSLNEYLQYTATNNVSESYFKVQLSNFRELFDFDGPEVFNCWYRATANGSPKTDLRWLYIGGNGTQTKLHLDVWHTNAWNYLISGTKIWFIYPENTTKMILENSEAYEFDNYLNNHEEFTRNRIRPLICIQQPGDLIFSPGNCLHSVYNVGLTYSVTENFINETCYDRVLQFFKRSGNIKSLNSLNSIVAKGFSELNMVSK